MKILQPRTFLYLSSFIALGCGQLLAAVSANLVENPGFEDGDTAWSLGIPSEAEGLVDGFKISKDNPHSGQACASLSSSEPTRYILIAKTPINVSPGDKIKMTAWVRFGYTAVLKTGFPGVYFRAGLMTALKQDISDPLRHLHVGLGGKTARSTSVMEKLAIDALPSGWTKIEGVVEIPEETAYAYPTLVVHGVSGTVFWDDVSIEIVSSKTPKK